jgi:REP element-mobilizing transposase RayT
MPNVKAGSLGAIVRSFKSAVTTRINECRGTPGETLWQRNYHERIIRDERELNDTRQYIEINPARWAEDIENPAFESMGG